MLRIVTWNLLHRVHGENHREPVLQRFPDEGARIEATVAQLGVFLRGATDLICLQEVSGDCLAAITKAFPSVSRFTRRCVRVPRFTSRASPPLGRPEEHVVVLCRDGKGTMVEEHAFENDAGKGFVAVKHSSGLTVFSTHVSWGPRREPQLGLLKAYAATHRPMVIGGDFNVEREAVLEAFGQGFEVSALTDELPTRVDGDGTPLFIDHVVTCGVGLRSAVVVAAAEVSDHRPVAAEVTDGRRS